MNMIIAAEVIDGINQIPDKTCAMCITSPPYYGLRDYGNTQQIGLERTPEEYINRLVDVFRGVRRVLKDDGTLWVVIGDSYAGSGKGGQSSHIRSENWQPEYPRIGEIARKNAVTKYAGDPRAYGDIKNKDLIGIPWMLAFALRNDGWYLRSDIIWSKPNVMPSSVKDRPTVSHEHIFLLSKSRRYYYDYEAIKEPAVNGDPASPRGSKGGNKLNAGLRKQNAVGKRQYTDFNKRYVPVETRNKRDVWTIPTQPIKEAHFATFPEKLVRPCILAGSRVGDIVLDPFIGSGTTAIVASAEGRQYIGIDVNEDYVRLAEQRIKSRGASDTFTVYRGRDEA